MVNELIDRTTITSATGQKSLLLALSRFLVDGASKDSIKRLSGMRIFPIRTVKSTSRLMNYNLDVWYIPDREYLRDCFDGKVPLLDFTSREVQESMPLFKAINREDSLLSRAVKETAILDGISKRDPEREELRERVKYLKPWVHFRKYDIDADSIKSHSGDFGGVICGNGASNLTARMLESLESRGYKDSPPN